MQVWVDLGCLDYVHAMTTKPIVPNILGQQSETALRRERDALLDVLTGLQAPDWTRPTPAGAGSVARVVLHLCEGFERLAQAWGQRLDAEPSDALLHTFDDPSAPPEIGEEPSDPATLVGRFRDASQQLLDVLSTIRQADWSWPVWSPLGGAETLAEAVRRSLSHLHLHHQDVRAGLDLPRAEDPDLLTLVNEFVLDAVVRRGGGVVEPPMTFEVICSSPGAGTWTIVIEPPHDRREVDSVWDELVGQHPEAMETHRIERGSTQRARATIRTDGAELWRIAFGRAGSWTDLEVHGDDQAKDAWKALITELERVAVSGLGRVHH